jgi:hypothetical protein
MQQYKDLKLNPFKFVTAVLVSNYSALIRCFEIWGICCAICVTVIGVFISLPAEIYHICR